jgi:hypothetical protein
VVTLQFVPEGPSRALPWSGCLAAPIRMTTDIACRAKTIAPSIVSTRDRHLVVQRRGPDGTLGLAAPYVMKGVVWSPASRDTDTYPTDPQNANKRRAEFAKRTTLDLPLLRALNANTVRLPIDPGTDGALGRVGMDVLDQLHDRR